ncbi:universal stress protein [Actinoplanes teichomyceticus]|uniref:Nucleotide-binding universal stress UspA family protein n=1 Tax=Actinoplanes teichomyceticus TaxID=1867 RepID=A0A561WK82_ACTTI|nr:universal stress protein [Actinoplanes teichomyceticus]TWG24286.1 nucleotide-binding universal stress UspA family protein [Actinoplanes teichomyceticus]GIF12867.1 universal stress protein [Actinoplanes teichomyceticus]
MNPSSSPPVIAGVSGSPASCRAVEAAAREAATRGCPLHLVHAINCPPCTTDHPRAAGDLLQQAVATATATAPGLAIVTELVEGYPVTGLLRRCRHAELTVIGDGGLNDQVCLPADAVAVQIAARSFGTVMVTRAAPAPAGPILVGVDGAGAPDPLLDFAFDEAASRRTGLLVIHVGEDRDRELDEVVATRALKRGVQAQVRVLGGDPTAVLRRESQESSLIVVGARGRQPYHGLLGSVAQTLLHHGRGPIVVVRGASRPRSGTRVEAPAAPAESARV